MLVSVGFLEVLCPHQGQGDRLEQHPDRCTHDTGSEDALTTLFPSFKVATA